MKTIRQSTMKKARYHYTECGLDNVYVYGLNFADDDGEETILVPCIQALHWCIAKDILMHRENLSGKELRFLRSEIEWSAAQVADFLKVDAASIQKIEQGNEVMPLIQSLKIKVKVAAIMLSGTDYSNTLWHQKDQAHHVMHESPSAQLTSVDSNAITVELIQGNDRSCYRSLSIAA